MRATITSYGEVHITYNMQTEHLKARNGQWYLPCAAACGRLLSVAPDVVASECDQCREVYESEVPLDLSP